MNYIYILAVAIMLFHFSAKADERFPIEETVFLKNGSIIKGFITEIVPGGTYTIETNNGSRFVVQEYEIERITRESISIPFQVQSKILDYKPKYREVGITLGTPGGINLHFGVNSEKYHSHFGLSFLAERYGFSIVPAYILSQNKEFRHFIGLGFGMSFGEDVNDYMFIGPVYNINVFSMMIELGIGYGFVGDREGIVPHLQVGFSPRFNKLRNN